LQHVPRRIRAAGLAAVVGIALGTAGGVHIALAHGTDIKRYAAEQPVRQMTLATWQNGGWAELPARRTDLLGEYEEPFILQWAGPLHALKAELLTHGWTAPAPWTFRTSLEWLSPQANAVSLPVLPQLNGGYSESLVLIRTGGSIPVNQRLVLRVWRSDVMLSAGRTSLPLWLGTVTFEQIRTVASLVALATRVPGRSSFLKVLSKALPSAQMAQRKASPRESPLQGFVLLGRP
jgi:LssY C-terminus